MASGGKHDPWRRIRQEKGELLLGALIALLIVLQFLLALVPLAGELYEQWKLQNDADFVLLETEAAEWGERAAGAPASGPYAEDAQRALHRISFYQGIRAINAAGGQGSMAVDVGDTVVELAFGDIDRDRKLAEDLRTWGDALYERAYGDSERRWAAYLYLTGTRLALALAEFTGLTLDTMRDLTGNVEVVLVIDSSGSMSWNDPRGLRREAAKVFIDIGQQGDRISVVDFDSGARVLAEGVVLADDRSALKAAVDRVDSSGGTSLSAGLRAAHGVLSASPSRFPKAVVFLTDGEGSYSDEANLFQAEGWPVYTIGLGSSTNAALLAGIASLTGGDYLALSDADQLKDVYFQIASRISNANILSSGSSTMLTGQTTTTPVDVPPYQRVVTFISSWGGSDVQLTLITPSGVRIGPETLPAGGYHSKGATYEVFRIAEPEAGTWLVELFGVDLAPDGERVTLNVSSLGVPTLPDTTAPAISVSSPVEGRTYFDQLPTPISFTVEDLESAVIDQGATLNGTAVSSGDAVRLTSLGRNELRVWATNAAGLTSEQVVSFNVDHFQWLAPYSSGVGSGGGFAVSLGKTVPIKFGRYDLSGAFVASEGVSVMVEGTTASFSSGAGVRLSEGPPPVYILNLHTNLKHWDYSFAPAGRYVVTVSFDGVAAAKADLLTR